MRFTRSPRPRAWGEKLRCVDATGQGAAELRAAGAVGGSAGGGRVHRPVRPVRVEGARQPIPLQDVPERHHDGGRALAPLEQLGVQQVLGGIVDDGQQGLPLRGHEGQPGVEAAIEVQQLAKARAGLPAPAVPPARPPLGQQARLLERRLDVGVGQGDVVVATRELVEVAAIEALVPLAVEPQHTLDLSHRRPPQRGPPAPSIEESLIASVFEAPAPAAHRAIGAPDDFGGLHPTDRPTHRPQHHFPNRHGPLQGRRREEHGRPPGQPSHSTRPAQQRTVHLLSGADRSCAPYKPALAILTPSGYWRSFQFLDRTSRPSGRVSSCPWVGSRVFRVL